MSAHFTCGLNPLGNNLRRGKTNLLSVPGWKGEDSSAMTTHPSATMCVSEGVAHTWSLRVEWWGAEPEEAVSRGLVGIWRRKALPDCDLWLLGLSQLLFKARKLDRPGSAEMPT